MIPSGEYPDLPEVPKDVHCAIPNDIGDYLADSWHEAMAGLMFGIDRVSRLSVDTWPKALHTVGSQTILFRDIVTGPNRSAHNIIVNESYADCSPLKDVDWVETYDFVVPKNHMGIAMNTGKAFKTKKMWDWSRGPNCGPIIETHNNFVLLSEGAEYAAPSTPDHGYGNPEISDAMRTLTEIEYAERLKIILFNIGHETLKTDVLLDQI